MCHKSHSTPCKVPQILQNYTWFQIDLCKSVKSVGLSVFRLLSIFHKSVEKCMYNHLNNSVITLWKSTHTRLRLMKCGYPQGYYLVFRKFFTIFDRKKI